MKFYLIVNPVSDPTGLSDVDFKAAATEYATSALCSVAVDTCLTNGDTYYVREI